MLTINRENQAHPRQTPDKPALLMLSHCVPDAVGSAPRARAWELLWLATQTHHVYLATVADGAVDLAQWRTLKQCTAGLALEPRRPFAQWLHEARRQFGVWARLQRERVLQAPIMRWRQQVRFDAIICTHPNLWSHIQDISARLTICDVRTAMNQVAHAQTSARHSDKSWRQLQRDLLAEFERFGTPQVLTVSEHDGADALSELAPTQVLPQGIDLAYYADLHDHVSEATPGERPRVLMHVDNEHRSDRRCTQWFVRDVWPNIVAQAPEARLELTRSHGFRPLSALRQASIVAAPHDRPASARFPVLQAMAMHRPVIASARAMGLAGARHGEHLLLSRSTREWVDCCVAALCSATIRTQLGRGARAFVERHGPIAQTGRLLLETLRQPQVATGLRQAA